MNKIKDLLLLAVTFTIAILLSVNLPQADSAIQNPPQFDIPTIETTLTLPTDALPVDLEKDGWHYSVYRSSFGVLCHSDTCLIAWNINDYYVTPWGKCFWHDTAGWQFAPAQGPEGKELTLPTEASASAIYGIDVSRTYERDGWKYWIQHLVPPRDRYHHEGHLYYKGILVPDGNRPNDFMITPFGTLYWHGKTKATRYGPQGWMRTPNPRYPMGDEIEPVPIDEYDFVD